LVVYKGIDEVIVCAKENEQTAVKDFFEEGGRDLDDYERSCSGEFGVSIVSSMRLG